MAKKILGYILAALCGAVLCGITIAGIAKNNYTRQAIGISEDIDKLKGTAARSAAIVVDLQRYNSEANGRIDKLEAELRERDRRFAARFADLSSELGRTATAIEGSNVGIDAVIEGLGQLKPLVEALP